VTGENGAPMDKGGGGATRMPRWDGPSLVREMWRLVRFGAVGVVSTATYAGTSWLLVWTGTTTIMVATVIAYLAAGTVSYLGHVHITFAVEPQHAELLSRFLVVSAVSFVLALGITWAITEILMAPHYVAILAVVVVIPMVNYLSHRFWVFSPHLASRQAAIRRSLEP
jgi:putative flippase GtrA